MNSHLVIFKGSAHVYLQGKGALQAIDTSSPNYHTYFVGTEKSSIKVKDHRLEPIQAAKASIENRLEGDFADIFNQPAEVTIEEQDGVVEIEMKPGEANNSSPTLWMGVIHDGKMPVHKITWEALKPIQENKTAFAVLADD